MGQGHQHLALHLRPAHVGVTAPVVVVAEADHLHGLLTVQVVLALGVVDVQVLIGVVIVHVHRHVEPHAAHGLHQLFKGGELDFHIVVNREPPAAPPAPGPAVPLRPSAYAALILFHAADRS